jgi:hypothetical protein
MNDTIKGIIIVVAITSSMLVVGATTTMIPIMQNSFASKKYDFKEAERDPNTNINTNTNTNINTNSGDDSTTTVTSSSTTGNLVIHIICPTTIGKCGRIEFPITVTGNNPQPSSFTLRNEQSQYVKLGPGSYTVHESVPRGFYTPRFTGDCEQTGHDSPDATGTISGEHTQSCHIINH